MHRPTLWLAHPSHHVEQSRLATTVAPHDRMDLTTTDLDVDAARNPIRLAVESEVHRGDGDERVLIMRDGLRLAMPRGADVLGTPPLAVVRHSHGDALLPHLRHSRCI